LAEQKRLDKAARSEERKQNRAGGKAGLNGARSLNNQKQALPENEKSAYGFDQIAPESKKAVSKPEVVGKKHSDEVEEKKRKFEEFKKAEAGRAEQKRSKLEEERRAKEAELELQKKQKDAQENLRRSTGESDKSDRSKQQDQKDPTSPRSEVFKGKTQNRRESELEKQSQDRSQAVSRGKQPQKIEKSPMSEPEKTRERSVESPQNTKLHQSRKSEVRLCKSEVENLTAHQRSPKEDLSQSDVGKDSMSQKSAFGLAGKNSKTGSEKYSKPPKPEGVKFMKSGVSGLSENQKSPIKPKPDFEKSTLSQKSPKSDISKKSGPQSGLASKPKLQDTASNQSHTSNTPEKSVDTAKLISYTQTKKSFQQTPPQPQTSSPAILSKQTGLQQKLAQFRVNEDTPKTKQPTTTANAHDSPKKIQNFVNSETGIKIDHLFIKQ
jgi:hypothetical protein